MNDDAVLTISQVQALLRCSRAKVYRLIRGGALESTRLKAPGRVRGTYMVASRSVKALLENVGMGNKIPARRLRVPEAAKYLGIAIDTLNQLRSRGGGPRFIKIGDNPKTAKIVLYDTDDLDAWLEANKYGSTADLEKCAATR